MTNKACIVLPAHNEELAIGQVIKDIQNVCDHPIYVSCSGCTDDTELIAVINNAEVIKAPKGKGKAIAQAFKEIKADKVVMMDSDSTYPASAIPLMLKMLEHYDSVIGVRKLNRSNMPLINHWGNSFITKQAQVLYNYPIHDLCTGMWAFRGEIVRQMDIKSYGFTLEAEMFVWLIKHHCTIGQVPIEYNPRIGKKKINRLDHLKIMGYLWRHVID